MTGGRRSVSNQAATTYPPPTRIDPYSHETPRLVAPHLRRRPAAALPNVLWITLEDTSPQFIGIYVNASARTPNT